MCDGLTAKQLDEVELFLKVERSCEEGWNSCTQMPTSLRVAVGVLADDSVAAMNDSESMENGALCMKYGEVHSKVSSSQPTFFFFVISPIDKVFALFVSSYRFPGNVLPPLSSTVSISFHIYNVINPKLCFTSDRI